jgi:hypothetical protein
VGNPKSEIRNPKYGVLVQLKGIFLNQGEGDEQDIQDQILVPNVGGYWSRSSFRGLRA